MGVDADLLRSYELEEKPPILRVYSWQEKCATFGSKQNRTMVMEKLIENLPVACRPTGGGICIHDEADLAVSLFLPNARRDLPRIRRLQNVLCQWVKEECTRSTQLQGVSGEDSVPKQNRASIWCAERRTEGDGCSRKVPLNQSVSVLFPRHVLEKQVTPFIPFDSSHQTA